jgi:hypothetical protein
MPDLQRWPESSAQDENPIIPNQNDDEFFLNRTNFDQSYTAPPKKNLVYMTSSDDEQDLFCKDTRGFDKPKHRRQSRNQLIELRKQQSLQLRSSENAERRVAHFNQLLEANAKSIRLTGRLLEKPMKLSSVISDALANLEVPQQLEYLKSLHKSTEKQPRPGVTARTLYLHRRNDKSKVDHAIKQELSIYLPFKVNQTTMRDRKKRELIEGMSWSLQTRAYLANKRGLRFPPPKSTLPNAAASSSQQEDWMNSKPIDPTGQDVYED